MMKRLTRKPFLQAAAGILMLWTGGCYTLPDPRAQQAARAREDQLIRQEREARQEGRFQSLELEVQQLRAEVDRLRQQTAASAEDRARLAQIEDLTRRLRELEARREKDRQEIIDTLSKKIADLVGRSGGGSNTTSARKPATGGATGGSSGGSKYGYEHVVKTGEALSAIASAYGVSVKAILDANSLTDPNKLRVGQKLFIPEP
jgi:nucleoid-associated protein YgaU